MLKLTVSLPHTSDMQGLVWGEPKLSILCDFDVENINNFEKYTIIYYYYTFLVVYAAELICAW